jgi:hypothetical protein
MKHSPMAWNGSVGLFLLVLCYIIVIGCSFSYLVASQTNSKLTYVYRLLDTVTDALTDYQIDHHIDGGTLLGCIRDNGLLPNDTDVQVTIHSDDWDTLKQVDFSKFGLVKTREDDKVKGYGRLISLRSPDGQVSCDIHANPGFPYLETVTVTIPNGETRTYNIPTQSDLYLTLLYGDWRVSSGKHAAWPEFFYSELLTSEYEPYWDRYLYIH